MRTRNPLPSFTTALLLLFLSSPITAAQRVLLLTPEETEVTFLLEATGHDIDGTLYLSHGEIRFDPETGQASGEVAIDARRSQSGNQSRDKTMRNKVLETAAHPLIVFVPQEVRGTVADSGSSEVELLGTLTLVGQEHPFTLPTTVKVVDGRLQASSTFTVPYIEWGLHDPSILFLRVAKEVEVKITAKGALQTSGDPDAVSD